MSRATLRLSNDVEDAAIARIDAARARERQKPKRKRLQPAEPYVILNGVKWVRANDAAEAEALFPRLQETRRP